MTLIASLLVAALSALFGVAATIFATTKIESKKQEFSREQSIKGLYGELEDLAQESERLVRTLHALYCKFWLVDNENADLVKLSPYKFPSQIRSEFLKEYSMLCMHEQPSEVRRALKVVLYLCDEVNQEIQPILTLGKSKEIVNLDAAKIKIALSTASSIYYLSLKLTNERSRYRRADITPSELQQKVSESLGLLYLSKTNRTKEKVEAVIQ
ncbi:hypothetical protein VCRA2133E348_220016 [Vibrio crassostreae]|nr:hypothetical protein VCRA2133E348_220016 [Vibrio crassostreae]CAK3256976.1 hypothetical protein VCRA213O314_200079 [Vibrio crassostreae]